MSPYHLLGSTGRSYHMPGMSVTEHVFSVPLDHYDPGGRTIDVFARELVDPARADRWLPWLLYLQGGPGGKAPRPLRAGDGWLGRALETHRVLLLDQRGTGRSHPVTARSAAGFGSAGALADYLACFRADSIVADAELIRRRLCGEQPWETLGQSFGGFITLSYLSIAPEGLASCYITGGLPDPAGTADDVYALTYSRVRDKTHAFYDRYPQDRDVVRRIADLLDRETVLLPDGDRLTSARFRVLGLMLGMGDGAERLHWLLDEALGPDGLSDAFRYQVMQLTGFVDNPLFAVLQESVYAQGCAATAWSAHRAMQGLPDFSRDADPLLFTGEMFFPWMFRGTAALRPFAEAADVLAERADWPPLYDLKRLADNDIPVAAVVYHDDMYVPVELSLRAAKSVGSTRAWVTNEWEHDGVNASGDRVLSRLIDMAAGRV
ncbi:pimeloyl-ACP methyl ester carboxylesterase [Saccharothrix tamanrassetensis]|uniref:Pimeloyl-ACP methyl ester carboxylesterase n=1 Tax=Saccharothrix tamanrassetensis TaxID=1051531 RepID=A0A841CNV3_9PSEU|nr:alpha/beta fold hydrolase [Saccharothrix tamanrassetensis]MBB5958044.1 pimeloyl-ACP methyl ester carboxylesterase [Saccharothrix tamanrassetensis]